MAKRTRKQSKAEFIPERAVDWVRGVFAVVNKQVTETLSLIPTHHEPELDMQFIAALNRAPAVADVSGWTENQNRGQAWNRRIEGLTPNRFSRDKPRLTKAVTSYRTPQRASVPTAHFPAPIAYSFLSSLPK